MEISSSRAQHNARSVAELLSCTVYRARYCRREWKSAAKTFDIAGNGANLFWMALGRNLGIDGDIEDAWEAADYPTGYSFTTYEQWPAYCISLILEGLTFRLPRPLLPFAHHNGLRSLLSRPKGQGTALWWLPFVARSWHCYQTLLARNYRGDIPMSAVEKFPVLLSEAEEESSAVPPCFSDEGINVRALYLWRSVLRKNWNAETCSLSTHSTSTSDITTSTSLPSRNATPTPPKSSFSCTRSLKCLQSISKNLRRSRYGIIL